MKFRIYKSLSTNEKKTFQLHSIYSAIDGLIRGILILNEYIFIKSLNGTSYQLGMLFQFSVLVLIFSIFFNEIIRRTINKKRMLRRVAFLTHLPLLLLFLFPKEASAISVESGYHYIFLFIFLFYFLSRPLIFPTINLFLKHNYEEQNFGKLYSISTSLSKVTMLIATFSFGLLLDAYPFSFTFVYPIVGLFGVISIFLLSKIEYNTGIIEIKKSIGVSIKDSIFNLIRILKKNKPYRHFEIGFMLYGFAFMSTKAVITIFYNEALHLNYSSVAFYQNAFNIMAIFLLPVFGKLLGKIDPRKFVV
ncbi:MAG: MFS transporter, partial [Bacteroidales bacterium]|nr:MFS transporter [Bacteroidales bacterium]